LRLKHTYIQIKPDATIQIKTNYTTSKKTIEKFIAKKDSWIRKKLSLIENRKIQNDKFFLFGNIHDKKEYGLKTDNEMDKFYRQKTEETISVLINYWSEKMQLFPTHIGFRKAKTRWGSCSHKNRLSFNINLAKMHPDFIEYVVVHELAHIKHKNHSKEFWSEVEKYLPDYKKRKKLII
jgi:predicted metal-dependent hydrolase